MCIAVGWGGEVCRFGGGGGVSVGVWHVREVWGHSKCGQNRRNQTVRERPAVDVPGETHRTALIRPIRCYYISGMARPAAPPPPPLPHPQISRRDVLWV